MTKAVQRRDFDSESFIWETVVGGGEQTKRREQSERVQLRENYSEWREEA